MENTQPDGSQAASHVTRGVRGSRIQRRLGHPLILWAVNGN